ncbi:kinase-like protein [Heliocybe sulcata]|uniref:Kinase-like protein n=1 Tax=Heliocybe sulcata TaxID=5364 RepID=A0A5C3N824_9AGAM|nr:kinase-like protein [Heliocybe sulcata]
MSGDNPTVALGLDHMEKPAEFTQVLLEISRAADGSRLSGSEVADATHTAHAMALALKEHPDEEHLAITSVALDLTHLVLEKTVDPALDWESDLAKIVRHTLVELRSLHDSLLKEPDGTDPSANANQILEYREMLDAMRQSFMRALEIDEARLRSSGTNELSGPRGDRIPRPASLRRLSDAQERDRILSLRNGEALQYINDLYSFLQQPVAASSEDREDRNSARLLLKELCSASDQMPTDLLITDDVHVPVHPTFVGGFGHIYRGKCGKMDAALKRMTFLLSAGLPDRKRRCKLFLRQALVWGQLRHPFIEPFLGVHLAGEDIMYGVTRWRANGNIRGYIEAFKPPIEKINQLIFEVACGLAYLHEDGIVHGDVQAANVLVDEEGHARLSDFDLVTFVVEVTENMGSATRHFRSAGGPNHMAPEVMLDDAKRTEATDIYAFACTAWEMYTETVPFAWSFIIELHLDKRRRPPRPTKGNYKGRHMSWPLWLTVQRCWAHEPAMRLRMRQVTEMHAPELLNQTSDVNDVQLQGLFFTAVRCLALNL